MKFAVLGSGSGGNSVVLKSGRTTLLIDAGLSAKQLSLRLEKLGISPDDLDAICITHEHGDHIRGLDVFLKNRKIPIFINLLTRETFGHKIQSPVQWKVFKTGQTFDISDIQITSFKIQHDSADPVGFVFCSESNVRFGFISDVGHVTREIRKLLRNCHALCIESNYDEALLEADTKRPTSIKSRIKGRHGHLSNQQTAELIEDTQNENLKDVMLFHLSSDCNTPELAQQSILKVFNTSDSTASPPPQVHCAQQHHPSPWIKVTPNLQTLSSLTQTDFLGQITP